MSNKSKKLASEQNKNTKARLVAAAVAIATCGGIIFGRWSPSSEGIVGKEPVNGDGVCEQAEHHPYLRDQKGKELKDEEGKPVPNPYYSKKDCHDGDGVCDSATETFDRARNLLQDIQGPLETETSYDCLMEAVRKDPCGADYSEETAIARPRVKGDLVGHFVQRSQEEIEALYQGEAVPGNNYFVTWSAYEEVCPQEADKNSEELSLCIPESKGKCLCPSHQDCAPPLAATCGNGRWDRQKGEQCDNSSAAGKTACGTEKVCTSRCTCAPRPKPDEKPPDEVPRCGNGRVEEGEECDPRSIRDTCGPNAKCSSSCTCEDKEPQKTGACPSPLGDGILSSRISSAITSSSGDIRGQAQGGGSAMSASVTVRIDGSGIPTIAGASVSCDGSQCPANVNPAAISRLTLQGIQVTGMQGTPCTKTYGARVR